MNKRLTVIFFFSVFQILCNEFFSQEKPLIISKGPVSQEKPMATLYMYRYDRTLCKQWNYDIQFHGMDVYTLKKNSALEYKFINEGRLKVTVKNWINSWESTVWLNIEAGKTYYIKMK